MRLNEEAVWSMANEVYNTLVNKYEAERAERIAKLYGTAGGVSSVRFDRVIGPRSTKAVCFALVRSINKMLEQATEAEKTKLANALLDEMMGADQC